MSLGDIPTTQFPAEFLSAKASPLAKSLIPGPWSLIPNP